MSPPITRKVLLTGASGTLGYNVMRLLAQQTQYSVLAPVRTLRPYLVPFAPRVNFQKLVWDIAALKQYLSHTRPDVIVHCAAGSGSPARFRNRPNPGAVPALRGVG
ncbi:MAG: NAD-dependent epimerase/dehydratase family protein [Terriglobales bacterium]